MTSNDAAANRPPFRNLSKVAVRQADRDLKPRSVTTASGRTVTVTGGAQLGARRMTAALALRDSGKADSARTQQQATDARLAALGAVFKSARDSWSDSPEDHQALGAWVESLPDSVLPLDQVAELLTAAKGGAK